MIDFERQAWLNGHPFKTLGEAIAHKVKTDTSAIISFDDDAVTGQPKPDDLLHDEIEKLRSSSDFQAHLARNPTARPELNETEATAWIKDRGRNAAVTVHDNGLVTANALFSNPADQHLIQAEVDEMLRTLQRQYRIVKGQKTD